MAFQEPYSDINNMTGRTPEFDFRGGVASSRSNIVYQPPSISQDIPFTGSLDEYAEFFDNQAVYEIIHADGEEYEVPFNEMAREDDERRMNEYDLDVLRLRKQIGELEKQISPLRSELDSLLGNEEGN